jgi:hypothetical protein
MRTHADTCERIRKHANKCEHMRIHATTCESMRIHAIIVGSTFVPLLIPCFWAEHGATCDTLIERTSNFPLVLVGFGAIGALGGTWTQAEPLSFGPHKYLFFAASVGQVFFVLQNAAPD